MAVVSVRRTGGYGGAHDAVGDENEGDDREADLANIFSACATCPAKEVRTLYAACMRSSRGPVVPSFHPARKHTQHRTANWILALRRVAGVEAGTAVAGGSGDWEAGPPSTTSMLFRVAFEPSLECADIEPESPAR